MKINRVLVPFAPILALVLATGGCVAPTPSPRTTPAKSAPGPSAQATGAMSPAPAAAPRPVDWRDATPTPGGWVWQADARTSIARFGLPAGPLRAILSCDRTTNMVTLAIPAGSGAPAMTLTTSDGIRTRTTGYAGIGPGGENLVGIRFAANDPLLDSMAFSRGRFALEMSGSAPLVLPVWAEIGRVIEDCRR